MREETQQPMCAICKQPITPDQRPYRTLASGETAHLACDIEHPDDEKKPVKPARS